jgi:hypothetical protein
MATSGFGVLTSDPDSPVMTETSVSTNLFQSFNILTQLVIKTVGNDLRVLSVHNILLSIQKPIWNLVLTRVLHNSDDTFQFII